MKLGQPFCFLRNRPRKGACTLFVGLLFAAARLPESWGEPYGALGGEHRELLSESLAGQVSAKAAGIWEIRYDFSNADELNDWVEYPEQAGKGEWNIEQGFLVGQGRIGIHHSWVFDGALTAELLFRGWPGGRLHLFDDGRGQSVVSTDFRGMFAHGNLVSLLPWRKERHQTMTAVEMSFNNRSCVLTSDGKRFSTRLDADPRPGFMGILAWDNRVEVDRVVLTGAPSELWLGEEAARLNLIRKLESSSSRGEMSLPLSSGRGHYPWVMVGPRREKEGYDVDCFLRGADEKTAVAIGQRRWADYVLEGWFLLVPGGTIRLKGRWNPHRLHGGFIQAEFREGTLRWLVDSVTDKRSEAVRLTTLEAGKRVPFRITWYRQTFSIELAKEQVLNALIHGPTHGFIGVEAEGGPAEVGGLRLSLLPGGD